MTLLTAENAQVSAEDDLSIIRGRRVAVIGYERHERAHAMSLRTAGVDVRVGLAPVSGSRAAAAREGLQVRTPAEAAAEADVIVILAPDAGRHRLCAEDVTPHLKAGDALIIGHDLALRDRPLPLPPEVDVVRFAPSEPACRVSYSPLDVRGDRCSFGVEHDATGAARRLAVSYAAAVGDSPSALPAAPPRAAGLRAGRVVRLALHLTLAALPLLAISAQVFGVLPMHLTAALILLPLAVASGLWALFSPVAEDRIAWYGVLWGSVATVIYDVFRLDTVYLMGWWGDFIPTMGTWILGRGPDAHAAGAAVGYLWRYVGDGGGIGVAFFILVAATGLRRIGPRRLVAAAVGFAVFPVWTGLIATVGLSAHGQQMLFPLTPTTVTLSLIGHLIFGLVLGLGCARTRGLERDWPWPPLLDLNRATLLAWLRRRRNVVRSQPAGASLGGRN